jgi:PAS domain-containing protein
VLSMHDDDRVRYIKAYNQAVADPRRPTDVTYRIRQDGFWQVEQARFANLIGHPDLDAVIIAVEQQPVVPSRRAPGAAAAAPGTAAGPDPADPTWSVAFHLLADDLDAAVFRSDGDGRILYRNRRWAGLLPGADTVERVVDLFDPEAWRAIEPHIADQVVAGAERLLFEVLAADGRTVLSVSGRTVGNPDGLRSGGFVGTVAVVTAEVVSRRARAGSSAPG